MKYEISVEGTLQFNQGEFCSQYAYEVRLDNCNSPLTGLKSI